MRLFEVVLNIPSPYRIHCLVEIQRQLAEHGIEFFAHFMSDMSRAKDAQTKIWSHPDIPFPHKYWPDYGRGTHFFNPGLIWHLRMHRPDYLLVGSVFDTLTGMALGFLRAGKVLCAWCEGNTKTIGEMHGWKGRLKRRTLSKFRYVAVPGIEGQRYIAAHQELTRLRMPEPIILPNIVDETRFRPRREWDQEQIDAGNINMIIADEVHKVKDSASLQGKAILELDCDYKVALTGTPVMNQPIDIYTTLNWLGFEEHSAFAFKKHYCIMGGFGQHQIVGYKNLPELQSILDKCMLRRLKSDVLDLPEKIYINDYVEMTKAQIKLYDEVRNNLIENIDKIKLSPNPLVQLIRLRQVTGNPSILSSSINDNPKFSRMCEIIEDAIENGGKVLVFSNWTNVIEPAYELVKSMKYKKDGKDKRYNPAIYTGQNKDVREQEKDRFMTDPDCKVLLGTTGAMGTGLTLTAANTVIFLDEPWNRAIKDQCEDRVHRIGTKESPNIITIMCKGTIDERINDLVYKKGKMSDVLIDKEEDMTRNPKIVNYLLSLD